MSHDPIAYTYEADVHCPDCAMERFPACMLTGDIACGALICRHPPAEDSEGNEPGAVFPWDEIDAGGLFCGDCLTQIVEPFIDAEVRPEEVAP